VYADMRLAVEDKASESSDAHQRQRQNQVWAMSWHRHQLHIHK
jgi:hypothetical protein